MPEEWTAETEEQPRDRSGARIFKLTDSRNGGGSNIYCESPKASPDGKRFVFQREARGGPDYLFDFDRMGFTILDQNPCCFEDAHGSGIINSAYAPKVLCWHVRCERGVTDRIDSIDISTLDRTNLMDGAQLPAPIVRGSSMTVSPDMSSLVYVTVAGPDRHVIHIDLSTGNWDILFKDPEFVNPHIHFEPDDGEHLLCQQNRGAKVDQDGKVILRTGPMGATHYFITRDARHIVLPHVGEPHTAACTGHACWIGKTRKAAIALNWMHNREHDPSLPDDWICDERHPGSTLAIVGPDDPTPRFIVAPEHRFYHVSSSMCGRFLVCNSRPVRGGTSEIVAINPISGKHITLVHDCVCYAPTSAWCSSIPFFTADLKHVVYRSNIDGTWNIYAAVVPSGFLDAI